MELLSQGWIEVKVKDFSDVGFYYLKSGRVAEQAKNWPDLIQLVNKSRAKGELEEQIGWYFTEFLQYITKNNMLSEIENPSFEIISELERLAKLMENGFISEEEFEILKKKILS